MAILTMPLSTNRNDPLINDPDNDGKPGITIYVKIFGLINGRNLSCPQGNL